MGFIASIATLTGLGILFGIVLAYAARRFHVPVDPALEKVLLQLPGANCGSCGKAGCAAFAESLLMGEAKLTACPVTEEEGKKNIAALLGLELGTQAKTVACVHCCGGNNAKDKFIYEGIRDCVAANLVLGGQKECRYGCLTFATCVRACPFGAIVMTAEGFPRVIEEKCTACGICVRVCPKQLFDLIPHDPDQAKIFVACSSKDIGRVVLNVCPVGCIACRKCEKACPHGAMVVVDNLARIDYAKCTGSLECAAAVCPTKVIKTRESAVSAKG